MNRKTIKMASAAVAFAALVTLMSARSGEEADELVDIPAYTQWWLDDVEQQALPKQKTLVICPGSGEVCNVKLKVDNGPTLNYTGTKTKGGPTTKWVEN
jgi:hypothetical protein